jgi:hypothetical protein
MSGMTKYSVIPAVGGGEFSGSRHTRGSSRVSIFEFIDAGFQPLRLRVKALRRVDARMTEREVGMTFRSQEREKGGELKKVLKLKKIEGSFYPKTFAGSGMTAPHSRHTRFPDGWAFSLK